MPPKSGGASKAASKKAGGKKKSASGKLASTGSIGEDGSASFEDLASFDGRLAEDGEMSPTRSRKTMPRPRAQQRSALPSHDGPRPDEELHSLVREESKSDEASIERVYELLRTDEDVNQRCGRGYTPLAIAAIAGNGPLVSLLLERAADATLRSIHRGELPLHHAARCGNRIVAQLLCEPTAAAGLVDEPNNTGWRPLHIAALAGHTNVAVSLLRYRASINSRNDLSGGGTVLHAAVRLGGAQVAEELLDRDAEVDAVDALGRGALHFAAARADYGCVSLLLRSRADASRRGEIDKTPLELVPHLHPNREKVSTLLKAFARPSPEPFRTDARFDKIDRREVHIVEIEPEMPTHTRARIGGGAWPSRCGTPLVAQHPPRSFMQDISL